MSDQRHIYCVHNKLYDIAEFVNKHPGGPTVFADLKPYSDITPMIYTYHKDASLIFDVLSKYDISSNDLGLVKYNTNYSYKKYTELKARVYDEIRSKGLPLYWSTMEILYNLGGFSAYLWIWAYCIRSNPVSAWWFVLLATINISHCALLFHETSHYTGFKNQRLNTLISNIAISPVMTIEEWKWDHNYLHHSFTNTEFDSDFNGHQFTFRHSSEQPHYFQHRFQHLYVGALMCLGGFSGQIDSIKHKRWNALLLVSILYWCGIYNTLVFYLFSGFLFLVIAQVSHIQPECIKGASNDFLVNQVTSTINYRTDHFFTRFLCFGLDIQIEHHLFPNIPHSTLRKIQPVVRDYCAQNGITYIERSDVFEMAKSYWWHLYEMSKENNNAKIE